MDAHRWTITLANGHGDFWSKGSSQVVSGAYNLNNNNGNNTIKPAYESNRNSGYSLGCLLLGVWLVSQRWNAKSLLLLVGAV